MDRYTLDDYVKPKGLSWCSTNQREIQIKSPVNVPGTKKGIFHKTKNGN